MTQRWICRNGNARLIVIFLGWGADAGILDGVSRPGYDIVALYDYRSEEVQLPLSEYCEVCIIAWSFGVMEAARILGKVMPDNITMLLAVNGTDCPVDECFGIPPSIFSGTLINLNERNLRKFYRRMFASKSAWDHFCEHLPARTLDELTDELRILGHRAVHSITHLPWTASLISSDDSIFPPANQRAWCEKYGIPRINLPSQGHCPDWQSIIDLTVVDKEYVSLRFDDASASYDDEAEIQRKIASRLWSLTRPFVDTSHICHLLEIGCGSGILTNEYLQDISDTTLTLWDIAPHNSTTNLSINNKGLKYNFKQCDAELELKHQPEASLDLIISSSTVQWFHSPAGFLRNAAKALRQGGVLAFSTYGSEMCKELCRAGISTRPYMRIDSDLWVNSSPDLRLLHKEEAQIARHFDSPLAVFHHMRRSGVNAINRKPMTTSALRRAVESYPLDSEGKATLTFHPLYFIYRKL